MREGKDMSNFTDLWLSKSVRVWRCIYRHCARGAGGWEMKVDYSSDVDSIYIERALNRMTSCPRTSDSENEDPMFHLQFNPLFDQNVNT